MMRELNIGALPICGTDDRLKGMVTDRDIVVKCVAIGGEPAAVTTGELAQGTIYTVDVNADAEQVLQTMENHRIHRLPVLDHQRVVGIISEADLARHVSGSQVGQFVEVVNAGLTGPPTSLEAGARQGAEVSGGGSATRRASFHDREWKRTPSRWTFACQIHAAFRFRQARVSPTLIGVVSSGRRCCAVCDLSSSKRELLISTAILAPSMHNAQPWLFRFRRHAVEVYRDPRRELTAEDPDNRMTFVGVGAAVFNLRVAAATLGLRTSTVVLPDETRPLLAAEVTLESGPPDQADPELGALYPYVARRRTSRVPFEDRAVPAAIRTELEQAAACEDAALVWVEKPYRLGWLNDILLQARFADADEPRRLQERRRWVGGDRDREGVPSRSLGPRPTQVFSPVRDLAVAPADQLREEADFERHPTLGVLSTPHDSPRYWLAAGQALQRVLLVATAHGLSVSLLNQPLEHERIRWQVHDPRTAWAASQAVLRFGYGPEVPPTPRRTAAEFLLKDPTDETERLDGADEASP